MSRGLLTEAPIHPREVFRIAILEAAAALVLVHNHASGEPTPSVEGDLATANLVAAGHTIRICIIDHIIVGDDRYYSYAEANRLQAAHPFSFGSRHETRLHVEPRKRRGRARAGRTLQTNGSPK